MSTIPFSDRANEQEQLLYDPKPELLPYALAIQPHATYIITNPSDLRASAWNLAKDFATMTAAAQLALYLSQNICNRTTTSIPKPFELF